MPFWLDSWAGDHAGDTVGREPNRLLISVTAEGGQFPMGLYDPPWEISGFKVYLGCYLECLTPNVVGNIVAIDVKPLGGQVFSIGIARIGDAEPEPLTPGVHLFGVSLAQGGNQAATIATAIIDDALPFVEFHLPPPIFTFLRQSGMPHQASA